MARTGRKGVSQERGLPERWSATENIAWKTDLRGLGASSPIVWGDRIFVTSQVGTGPLTNAPHPPLVGVRVPGEPIGQPGPNERPIGGQLGRQSSSLSFVVAAFNRADGRQAWDIHAARTAAHRQEPQFVVAGGARAAQPGQCEPRHGWRAGLRAVRRRAVGGARSRGEAGLAHGTSPRTTRRSTSSGDMAARRSSMRTR